MKQISREISRKKRRFDFTPQLSFSFRKRWQFLGEARTRILLWYLLLMGFFVLVSLPLMRQFIFVQVDTRVREDLREDIELFQALLTNGLETKAKLGVRQPKLPSQLVIPPTTQQQFKELVDLYLAHRIPEDDSYLIAFVDGKLFRSSPQALPRSLAADSNLNQHWAFATEQKQGERLSPDPDIGSTLYIVEPVKANGEQLGTFVVAHTTAGEREEVLEALESVFRAMMVVLALALVLAWFASGKVLAPLRVLATTAHAITDTDLTQRIPVWGRGELADLAITFNEMMDRLEAAFATQRNFINDVGHELRTPITIIRGHLELMGNDPEEQQETLSLVLDELSQMSRFVEDLILLAKAERPDFLQLEVIDLKPFTEGLFAKAKTLADRHWQLEAIAPGRLVGDRQRITQAVMNLIQNATQHTNPSDTISIGVAVGDRWVRYWISDTGEGIALKDQERIFERFARANCSHRSSEGVGLGLSIVRAIAEAHGGRVHLRSQLGTGSTFTIVLPLEPPLERAFYDSNPDR